MMRAQLFVASIALLLPAASRAQPAARTEALEQFLIGARDAAEGRHASARAHLEKALALDNGMCAAHLEIARAYLYTNALGPAVSSAEKARACGDLGGEAERLLSQMYMVESFRGDRAAGDKAIAVLLEGRLAHPANRALLADLGSLYLSFHRKQEGLRAFMDLRGLVTVPSQPLLEKIAELQTDLGQFDELQVTLLQLVRYSGSAGAARQLADLHGGMGRDDAGEDVLRLLLEQNPSGADERALLARYLCERGRDPEAWRVLGYDDLADPGSLAPPVAARLVRRAGRPVAARRILETVAPGRTGPEVMVEEALAQIASGEPGPGLDRIALLARAEGFDRMWWLDAAAEATLHIGAERWGDGLGEAEPAWLAGLRAGAPDSFASWTLWFPDAVPLTGPPRAADWTAALATLVDTRDRLRWTLVLGAFLPAPDGLAVLLERSAREPAGGAMLLRAAGRCARRANDQGAAMELALRLAQGTGLDRLEAAELFLFLGDRARAVETLEAIPGGAGTCPPAAVRLASLYTERGDRSRVRALVENAIAAGATGSPAGLP